MSPLFQINVSVANPSAFPSATEPSEYVITKKPLRPKPGFEFKISGLNQSEVYRIFMKLEMVNGFVHKYKEELDQWIENFAEEGKEEDLMAPIWIENPHGEQYGGFWMNEAIEFPELHLCAVRDKKAIALKTLRFYKMTLVVMDANGNLFDFHDIRHSFRTVSKHTWKWAEFKKTPGYLNSQKKRSATSDGNPNVAKRRKVQQREIVDQRMGQVQRQDQFEQVPYENVGHHHHQQMAPGVVHGMQAQREHMQHNGNVYHHPQNAHIHENFPHDNYQMNYVETQQHHMGQGLVNGMVGMEYGHPDQHQQNMLAIHPAVNDQHPGLGVAPQPIETTNQVQYGYWAPPQNDISQDHRNNNMMHYGDGQKEMGAFAHFERAHAGQHYQDGAEYEEADYQDYPHDVLQQAPVLPVSDVVPEGNTVPIPVVQTPKSNVPDEDFSFLNTFFVTPIVC